MNFKILNDLQNIQKPLPSSISHCLRMPQDTPHNLVLSTFLATFFSCKPYGLPGEIDSFPLLYTLSPIVPLLFCSALIIT